MNSCNLAQPKSQFMKLFLFSASVFFLLGLKLTSKIELKSPSIRIPTPVESKIYPEPGTNIQSMESKPNLIKKDTTISSEIKSSRLTKTPKDKTLPQS